MKKKPIAYAVVSFLVVGIVCLASAMFTSIASADDTSTASIDESGSAATIDGVEFGISNFKRAQVGSNRAIEGTYRGYAFLTGEKSGCFSAVYADMEGSDPYVVLYIPQSSSSDGLSPDNSGAVSNFENMLTQLDVYNANGGVTLQANQMTWYVTSDSTYTVGNVVYMFDQEFKEGRYYTAVIGTDGSDVTQTSNPNHVSIGHCSYGNVEASSAISISGKATGLAAVGEFFSQIDYSPLFVTLKTTGVAIVIIFILGLLAAYWTLNLSPRMRDIMDAIFTIPMVLPPTVCGFLLLLLLGRNTPVGDWFISIGCPLIFSWPATVIAAVVVAFPLMYRSARGAFEGLDPNMLDAARTLGWSNFRIFRKLMLPLAWSSIAAGTALSFARALGEFGATLFLAGNYAGITQTIPIAIYFQWMNGRTDVALFWTVIIMIVSFAVILLINVWSGRTTKYRQRESDES